MNAMPTRFIIGDTATTVRDVPKLILPGTKLIGTSRKGVNLFDGNERLEGFGLDLTAGSDIGGQVRIIIEELFRREEINEDTEVEVDAEAMMMGIGTQPSISTRYPEEIVGAMRDYGLQVNNFVLTSFISPYTPVQNPEGSCVDYGARDLKNDIIRYMMQYFSNEKDSLGIANNGVFCSKSAKALGPTHIGTISQFLDYFRKGQITDPVLREIGDTVVNFLGDDYERVLEFMDKFPMTGPLSEGQLSMNQLAKRGKFGSIINYYSKQFNFAKLSRISPIITDIYILLQQNFKIQERKQILGTGKFGFNLDWDAITSVDLTELQPYLKPSLTAIKGLISNDANEEIICINGTHIQETIDDEIKLEFNISHLETAGGHFGVGSLTMAQNMIRNSGILTKGEDIKGNTPGSFQYTGNTLMIRRVDDKKKKNIENIEVYNPNDVSEIFASFEICPENTEEIPKKALFTIPKQGDNYNPEDFPHRKEWIETFIHTIPTEIGGIALNPKSAIFEHIGINLGAFIYGLGKEGIDILRAQFPASFKKYQKGMVMGAFGGVQAKYAPNFEELIFDKETGKNKEITIKIAKLASRMGPKGNFLIITTEEYVGDVCVSTHDFRII